MFHQAPSVASSSSTMRNLRRRSADVGGLHLAMMNGGGHGWLGVDGELETQYAESLSDMFNQTREAVKEHGEHFIQPDLSIDDRRRLIDALDEWHFEPHALQEWEKLACCTILFEGLYLIEGLEETICVPFHRIPRFLHELRQIYRLENSYHNFEHALDVLQASYSYLRSSGMVPSVRELLKPARTWKPAKKPDSHIMSTLGPVELFVMYLAAIGHDVGHPGLTNIFMKNAETPLSLVFDGKSPLEQLHYQLLVRVMRQYGMEKLLDHPLHGCRARKLLYETILATDMVVHKPFMEKFQQVIEGEPSSVELRQILVCQAILKCADISNPSRPYRVSKHWAGALAEEWDCQTTFEQHLHLPTSIKLDGTPIGVAKSQVWFIEYFASPLLETTVRAVPEMRQFHKCCQGNLGAWKKREAYLLSSAGASQSPSASPNTTTSSPRSPDNFGTAFPMTLPQSHRASPQVEESLFKWQMSTAAATSTYAPSTVSEANGDGSSADSTYSTPSPSASTASFIFSPTSETSTYTFGTDGRPPSSEGSTVGSLSFSQITVSGSQAAIRAAGKAGIRKQKSMNRNSWSPLMSTSTNSAGNSTVTLVTQTNSLGALTQQKSAGPPPFSNGSNLTTTVMMKPIKAEQTSFKQ